MYDASKYILTKHGVFIGFGYLFNGMFMLNISSKMPSSFMIETSQVCSSSTLHNSYLWHARLGHVHVKRMILMSKHNLIPSFDINMDKCDTCKLTKITRKPLKLILVGRIYWMLFIAICVIFILRHL